MLDFQKLSADYQQALLRQVVPFWLKHGRDGQCGGYFDTLSTTGSVIDSDKFVSAQAQQTWAFAFIELFDLRERPAPPADVIVANLMRPLLLRVAELMDERPAALIASGLLPEEADEIAAALAPMRERRRLGAGGWSALLLER